MKPATVRNNRLRRSRTFNKNLAHHPGHRYSNLMLVDAMAHLTDPRIPELSAMMQRAHAAGITHVVHAGIDPHEDPALPNNLPNEPRILKAFGIHPMAIGRKPLQQQLQQLEKRLQENEVVALGEAGLDKRSDMPPISLQVDAFKEQLKIARTMKLPVLIHCVQATGILLDVIKDFGYLEFGGVWHGYTGSPHLVSQIENMGLHISMGGMVTYANSKKCRLAAAQISPERLLVESDSPDHAPSGWPHQLSEPAAIEVIFQELSALRKEPIKFIREQTAHNARALFGFK